MSAAAVRIAFLFAGQGAQYPGMGIGFVQQSPAAAGVFAAADAACPGTYERCCAALPAELARTTVTQPTVLATGLACARMLEEAGVTPAAVAGFSLGEVGALACAGVFDDKTAFKLIGERARLMEAACQDRPGAMRAVLGKAEDELRALLEESGQNHIELVNFNAPTQIVVAGPVAQIEAFGDFLTQRKIRSVQLAVSGAFHSSFMDRAADDFARALARVSFKPAQIPVYSNVSGEPYLLRATKADGCTLSPSDEAQAKTLLARQIASPVQWVRTLENLRDSGITHFIEVGPGTVLTGLTRKTLPGLWCRSVQNPVDAHAVADELKQGRPGRRYHKRAVPLCFLHAAAAPGFEVAKGPSAYRKDKREEQHA